MENKYVTAVQIACTQLTKGEASKVLHSYMPKLEKTLIKDQKRTHTQLQSFSASCTRINCMQMYRNCLFCIYKYKDTACLSPLPW